MKRLTIRWRIIASFGVMLALIVTMTVLDYNRLLAIETEATTVEASALSHLMKATAVRDAWSDNLMVTEQFVLEPDETVRRRLEAQLQDSRETLETAITEVQGEVSTPGDRQALATFKAAQSSYLRVQDDLVRSVGDPVRRSQGIAMIGERLLPEYERGRAPLAALVASQKEAAVATFAKVAADVHGAVLSAKAAVLVDLLVALVLGVASGIGLMLAISRPLSTLKGLVDVMRGGDFTKRAQLLRRDEFGALADGFNRMADDLTALVGQVKDSSLKVNTSVTEIAATAKQQQATANEVAATATEIGATSREIAATSKELVRTMNDVSAAAEQSAAIAGSGQAGLTLMEQSMRNVIEAAGSVNTKLTTLNERAADISQVVTTITKVADQTNLLSLNAAIEAEKAGEYGRGFAVVATEIRRLADQTAVATHDIDRTVKAIQSAVSSSVMSMDKFSEQVRQGMQAIQDVGGQLTEIIQHTQALAPRFETVTEGMQAQAVGAEQITEALTQLSEAARQTVESLRQSTMAIDDLNQVSLGLRSGVSRFILQAA